MSIKKVLAALLGASMLFTTSALAVSENIENSQNDTVMVEKEITKQKASSGKCGDNLTWTLDDEGTLTISGTDDMDDYCTWEGENAPWYDCDVKKVIIEYGVTSIGDFTFSGCSNLTSITIPDSIMSIGNFAFTGCSSLTSVTIPNGVKGIYEAAFRGCSSLTSITIPASVDYIGYEVFDGCESLASITVDEGNQE